MAASLHPDHDRIAAYRRGDRDAARWLEERLLLVPRLVRHLAGRRGGLAAEDIADVSQEAAATALARLESYHGLAAFEAWLHLVCVNTLRSHLRRQRATRTATLEVDPAIEQPTGLDEAAQRERLSRLRAALDAIGGVEADAIRGKLLEGRDFADISARSGIPIATLRSRFYRGLEKLKRRFAPSTPSPPKSA